MPTEVLDVKIIKIHRLTNPQHPVKAFVDLGINDALLIKGVRVVESQQGLFVGMPSELGKDDKWYERVRCLSNSAKDLISQKVLEAYNTELN